MTGKIILLNEADSVYSFERQLEWARMLEERYSDEKKALASSLFSWADEFSQTEIYHNLLKKSLNKDYGLQVFGHYWGHEIPYNCIPNCWSRLHLKTDGSFVYGAGYRSHGTSTRFLLKTPNELKDKLCYEYLREFAKKINSLEVYAYMYANINASTIKRKV